MDLYNLFKLMMLISIIIFGIVDFIMVKDLILTIRDDVRDFRKMSN